VTWAPAAPQDNVTTAQAERQVGTTDTEWYRSVSYGQFAGWDAQAIGWFKVTTPPLDSGACVNAFRATVQGEANKAAEEAGYNPSSYDAVMYYFSGVPCGWGGWENGANPAHIWINGTMGTTGSTVHELGHTLGLGHGHSYPCNGDTVSLASSASCSVEEYGDPYDVMGQAFNGGPGSAGSFTAMQRDSLGWMEGRETTSTSAGSYTIAPLEQQSPALQAVKVVDGSETFWVEYRQPIGVDAWLSNYPQATSGVRILLEAPDDAGFPAPGSYLLDMTPDGTGNFYDAALPVGSTFCDPLGNDAIKLDSANASGATISITTDPCITAAGKTVSATEGEGFSGTVATFEDRDTSSTASDYSATIEWGDGAKSTGTVTGGSGSFSVSGDHTYAEEQSYPVKVRISDIDEPNNTAAATSTATVADAALGAGTLTVPRTSLGQPTSASFSFTDANTGAATADFMASINWGDGSSTPGAVTGGSGNFTVSGSHTYAASASYPVTVEVTDDGGSKTEASAKAKVIIVISGTFTGHLIVKSGESVELSSTGRITGRVTVEPGGELDVEGGTITGPLTADDAAQLRLCGGRITGGIQVTNGGGPVVLGEGTVGCPGNRIDGRVTVKGNQAAVLIDGNFIQGPLAVTGNSGGTTVRSNSVLGALTVTGNSPPVVDRPNAVIGPSTLQ
jgi:hypothetical protein